MARHNCNKAKSRNARTFEGFTETRKPVQRRTHEGAERLIDHIYGRAEALGIKEGH